LARPAAPIVAGLELAQHVVDIEIDAEMPGKLVREDEVLDFLVKDPSRRQTTGEATGAWGAGAARGTMQAC
jgi:hypothetical protein